MMVQRVPMDTCSSSPCRNVEHDRTMPKSKSCGCLIDVHLLKSYKMIADFCCNPSHRGKTYQSGNDRATSPAPFMRTIDLLEAF